MKRLRTVCVCVSLCLCVFFVARSAGFSLASSESDAGSVMAQADQRVISCYSAAAEAEKAGANVTGVLSVLDEAGGLLCRARLAFQQGDFDSAYSLAVQCNTSLSGFESQTASLREAAEQQGRVDFAVNVVGSTLGAFSVVFGGLSVWFYLRRRPERSASVAAWT